MLYFLKIVFRKILLAYFILTFCSIALAQLENGAIVGTVRDSEEQAVPGVTITASSASLVDRSIHTVTDSDGRYRFPALPPGVYQLKTDMSGFVNVMRSEVRLFVGSTITVDFQLDVESVDELVEVSGALPLIDITSAAVQHTVAMESVQRLPKFKSVLDLIKLTPGVGDLDLVAYGGAGEAANAYWYDGVDIRSPASGHFVVLPNYNWIEEVQVVGLGASAEYSGFTGVVSNFVTRSGGNEFHGLVESFFSNEALVSENVPDSAQDTFKLIDTSTQLGGPILRDKLWFFTGFQYFYDQREPFGFPDSVTQKQPRFFTKLTYKINPDNTLQGSAYYDHLSIKNDFADATFLPEAAANSDGAAWSWNASWLSVLSPSTYLEARFGGYDNGGLEILPKNGNTPGHLELATGILSVNLPGTTRLGRKRAQINASVSHYANDFIGQHDFKFGVEFERSRSDSFYQYNGNLLYYDLSGQPYYRYLWDGPYIANDSIHRTSTFAQDTWKPTDRLTLDLGVRWDHIRGISALHTIPFDPVAPRLGFTYDIKGDGKTILKSHYGHYYDGFFDGYLQLFNDMPTKTTQLFDSGQWIDLPTSRQLNSPDGDLKQTYIRQFIVSVDQQLRHEIVLGVRYIYRRWNNIVDNQNISGRYEEVPFFNPITQETITVFNRIDQGDIQFVITNQPDLFRQYDGFEITAEKRFSRNLFLSGSIVISRAKGNIDNVDSSRNAADRVFDDPNFNINIYGKLVNDPTYQIKIFGGYHFPWEINSSFFFRHESGDTWTPLIRVPGLRQSAQGPVNIFGLPRGSNRFPSRNILDLRAEKAFPIHNGQLRFTADFFNVFNTAYVLNVNRVFGSNFEQPIEFTSPREVRLGVRYTF